MPIGRYVFFSVYLKDRLIITCCILYYGYISTVFYISLFMSLLVHQKAVQGLFMAG